MKKLDNAELVAEYFESVKDKYPGLTLQHCKEVVSTPFVMLKNEMSNANLSTVRLKYLGTFLVYKARAKGMLEHWKTLFKYHKIDKNEYFKKKAIIEEYINKPE